MRILNLGAGVQSTTIFLMAHEGLIEPIDHAIFVNRNMDQAIYLHRSLIPLEMVDLEAEAKKEAARKARPLFDLMCEGMCGN